jgi:hypothetical protein
VGTALVQWNYEPEYYKRISPRRRGQSEVPKFLKDSFVAGAVLGGKAKIGLYTIKHEKLTKPNDQVVACVASLLERDPTSHRIQFYDEIKS